MRAADWIGFDLDHTLARYKHHNVQHLIYDCLVRHLVEIKHYPAHIFARPYDPHFCTKGVVLDKELGHFLTLDEHKHVLSEVCDVGQNWSTSGLTLVFLLCAV